MLTLLIITGAASQACVAHLHSMLLKLASLISAPHHLSTHCSSTPAVTWLSVTHKHHSSLKLTLFIRMHVYSSVIHPHACWVNIVDWRARMSLIRMHVDCILEAHCFLESSDLYQVEASVCTIEPPKTHDMLLPNNMRWGPWYPDIRYDMYMDMEVFRCSARSAGSLVLVPLPPPISVWVLVQYPWVPGYGRVL